MSNAALQALAWVLIYGGLVLICVGVFVPPAGPALRWALIVVGALATAAGMIAIWLRSRRP